MGSAHTEDVDSPSGLVPDGIKDVAVIGAGISGVSAAAHLLRVGINVTLFERTGVIGGVWHLDPRPDIDPPFPNDRPSRPDWKAVEAEGLDPEVVALLHAPTSPCYAGLVNNIPTPVMRSSLLHWPEGTDEFATHDVIRQYVEDIASQNSVLDTVQFHTRVESVTKPDGEDRWTVRTSKLQKAKSGPGYQFGKKTWKFDAVVVASGHYNVPRVPDIPGLSGWKQRFPDRVMHSKLYRSPERFAGKTVLIIGAGVSSMDIAKETAARGAKVYQSVRESKYALNADRLPENAERVAMVSEFVASDGKPSEEPQKDQAIPGKVVLSDRRVLEGIDHVVVATGYITSYPFLEDLEQPSVSWEEADDKVVITSDGYITHNLHKDIFYIPDPTLAFVGVSHLVSTFSFFDFQAQVVARVFAGQVQLPSESIMKEEHKERKAKFQRGDRFHSLLLKEDLYMAEVLGWVNEDLVKANIQPMKEVDEEWTTGYSALKEKLASFHVDAAIPKD